MSCEYCRLIIPWESVFPLPTLRCRHHTDTIQHCTCTIPVQSQQCYQYHTSTMPVPYQYHASTIPVPYKYHINTIPAQCQPPSQFHTRTSTSTIPVPYKFHPSTILAAFPVPYLYHTSTILVPSQCNPDNLPSTVYNYQHCPSTVQCQQPSQSVLLTWKSWDACWLVGFYMRRLLPAPSSHPLLMVPPSLRLFSTVQCYITNTLL
jgi:hypothetical protein